LEHVVGVLSHIWFTIQVVFVLNGPFGLGSLSGVGYH